jgi:predicted HTH transcriptional regulator
MVLLRACFRNPGLLKLPVETIYRGGNSKARNPKIQNMLRMIGFGENVGSGFPKIIATWKETGWGEPELKNKIEVDEVELVLPVSAVTTNVVKDVVKELTDRQQVILGLIKENPSLSASEMSQKTGMVTRTIQRDLASLHEKGILTREGGRKDGKWVIII